MEVNRVDIEHKLLKERAKILGSISVENWTQQVFEELDNKRSTIIKKLSNSEDELANNFDFKKLETDKIFHINQIKKICIDYRLRFLDTKYFKGDFPAEAISKIRQLEKEHNANLNAFKIIAPSALFILKKADDPLLFASMGNEYYYLIHKWGKDLHPLRKYKVWSLKNVGNLLLMTMLGSLLFTLLFKDFVFANNAKATYTLVLFLFVFKFAIGFILFYGISTGKNFNEYIWKSRYNKVQ